MNVVSASRVRRIPLARAVFPVAAFVYLLLCVAPALAGATTIDQFTVELDSGTGASCTTQSFNTVDDGPPPVLNSDQGSGVFSESFSATPRTASASCPAGSATSSATGSLTSSGSFSGTGGLMLTESARGTASDQTTFTGSQADGDSVRAASDVADGLTEVRFTVTAPTPYAFSGHASARVETPGRTNGTSVYTLEKLCGGTTCSGPAIFSISQNGLDPSVTGTLDPGSYRYLTAGQATETLQALSANESASFDYQFSFTVGTTESPTSTSLSCPGDSDHPQSAGASGVPITCTVSVEDTCATPCAPSAPTGSVTIDFADGKADPGCTLAASATAGRSACQVSVTADNPGVHAVSATYPGDSQHDASNATETFTTVDHYQVELKAWIAQPHVVDPYQPVTLPTLVVDQLPLVALRPRCDLLTVPSLGTTSTTFRGDGHDGFAGSYRTDLAINFDWDGSQVSNFQTSGNNFGTTRLDFHVTWFDPISLSLNTDDCTTSGMATQSVLGGVAFGGQGFLLQEDASDPLISPQFAVPALDGRVLGLFNTQNDQPVLTLQFKTDIFPSFGVQVTKDGVVQATSLINDTSCMDPNSVLGPLGLPLLAFGLSSITQNTGQFTVLPDTTGATSARSSDLCSQSYDTLQLINNNLSFPAADVGASAAGANTILVAPANGGKFIPLATALKQGLLAGVQHPGHTYLLVDPTKPVRIKVIGGGVIAQETPLSHGRAGATHSFGPVAGTLLLSAGNTVTATLNGHKLKPRKPDHKPPITRATVTIKGKLAIIHLRATDPSGIAKTILFVASKVVALHHGTARINRSQLKSVRYYSVDALGNAERPRRLPTRRLRRR